MRRASARPEEGTATGHQSPDGSDVLSPSPCVLLPLGTMPLIPFCPPRVPFLQLLSQEPSNGLSSDPTVPLDRLAVIFRSEVFLSMLCHHPTPAVSQLCPHHVLVMSPFHPGCVSIISQLCLGRVPGMSWSCPHPILIVSPSCLIHDPVLSPFCPGCVPVLSLFHPDHVPPLSYPVLMLSCPFLIPILFQQSPCTVPFVSAYCLYAFLVVSPFHLSHIPVLSLSCPHPVTILSLSCPHPVPVVLLCPHSVSFVSYWRHLPHSAPGRHTNPIVENGQIHPCQKVIQEVSMGQDLASPPAVMWGAGGHLDFLPPDLARAF